MDVTIDTNDPEVVNHGAIFTALEKAGFFVYSVTINGRRLVNGEAL